jgi:hypothetical protein
MTDTIGIEKLKSLRNTLNQLTLENTDSASYSDRVFTTQMCGPPMVLEGLNIPIKLTQTYEVEGDPYPGTASNTVINCRDTSSKDLNGHSVYQASTGALFVFDYFPPSKDYPEMAVFRVPNLQVYDEESNHSVFSKVSEDVVDMLAYNLNLEFDELFKLKLTNKLTGMQTVAYQQGLGKQWSPK